MRTTDRARMRHKVVGAVTGAATLMALAACVPPGGGGGATTTSPPTTTPPVDGTLTGAEVDAALPKIDAIVADAMTRTGVPGVAVGVVFDDEVVFQKGYGVREAGKPETVDPDTVFQLASLSKPVSSTALAALVGDGVIAWDGLVKDGNPTLEFSDPWVTDHVTFADLYAHRSGLPGGAGDDLEAIGYTRDQILERFDLIPLKPFRTTYGYSNFGMTAAGDAAAKVAGLSFEDLMQTRLFDRAGMASSSASYADFLARTNRATLHARLGGDWKPEFERMPDAQSPAGGVSSSLADMLRWTRLQLGNGTLDGDEIVKSAGLAATHTPQILNAPLPDPSRPAGFYGLGFNVGTNHFGDIDWNHSGAFTHGAATRVEFVPEQKLGVVVLTNGMPIGLPEGIASNIIDTAMAGAPTQDWFTIWQDRFAGLFVTDPALDTPPVNPAPAQPDTAYTGDYANDYFGTFTVESTANGLEVVQGPDQVRFALTHRDGDDFVYVPSPELPDAKYLVSFDVTGGQATSVTFTDLNTEGWGTLDRV